MLESTSPPRDDPTLQRLLALARAAPASTRAYAVALAAIVAGTAALAFWNAAEYPPYGGYDNERNVEYAKIVYDEHRLPTPDDRTAYYKPPGFYAVAGWLMSQKDNRDNGRKYVQYFNAALLVATSLLVIVFGRLVWPRRRALHVMAVLFFVLLPAVPKMAAAFHPATMSVFFSALGLVVATWMVVRRRYGLLPSLGLALILVGGLLVTSQNIWVYGTILLLLLTAALREDAGSRLRAFLPLAVVIAVTAILAAPFYARQASKYGSPILALRSNANEPSLLDRRPREFYTAPDVGTLFTRPYRPSYTNEFIPTAYSELWGDYFGYWSWSPPTPPNGGTAQELVRQSWIGLLPTLLGTAGWIGLLVASVRERLRRPELVALTVLPAAALVGFLYYAIAVPSSDGDTIKASYMLAAAPAWALAFAWAADSLRRVRVIGPAVVLVLAGSALLSLPFLAFDHPLWGLL